MPTFLSILATIGGLIMLFGAVIDMREGNVSQMVAPRTYKGRKIIGVGAVIVIAALVVLRILEK